MASIKSESFKKSFDELNSIAAELKSNPDMDIDKLLQKAKQAVSCYHICKKRLDKATQELTSILDKDDLSANPGD